jgi:UDP-N-acetylmuramyl pentapeptide phosphotransferase/UDP-N-acetylglucosamine-1-phosphate transferase
MNDVLIAVLIGAVAVFAGWAVEDYGHSRWSRRVLNAIQAVTIVVALGVLPVASDKPWFALLGIAAAIGVGLARGRGW